MSVELMTVAEYARHRGCDEKAVRKALDERRISRTGTGRRCIDPEVADIQWAKNTRPRGDSGRAPRPPADGEPSPEPPDAGAPATLRSNQGYLDSRAKREHSEAMIAELELAKMRNSVIEREPTLRSIFTKFRELRDTGMSLGRRLAPRLAAMTDEREIRIAIDRAQAEIFEVFVTRSLQSLVDGINGKRTALPAEVREAAAADEEVAT